MENDMVTVTQDEKREVEKWIAETFKSNQNAAVDTLSLILHKLHLLEEKINRIEYQTKTHWAN
jgi:hypothetical protein